MEPTAEFILIHPSVPEDVRQEAAEKWPGVPFVESEKCPRRYALRFPGILGPIHIEREQ